VKHKEKLSSYQKIIVVTGLKITHIFYNNEKIIKKLHTDYYRSYL